MDEAIPHIFLKSISCRISGLATLWLLIYILIKPIAMKINADISDHTILISVDNTRYERKSEIGDSYGI